MMLVTRSIDRLQAVQCFNVREPVETLSGKYMLQPEGLRVRKYRVPLLVGYSSSVRELVGSAHNLRFDIADTLLADLQFASDELAQSIRSRWVTMELYRLEPIVQVMELYNGKASKWMLLSMRML